MRLFECPDCHVHFTVAEYAQHVTMAHSKEALLSRVIDTPMGQYTEYKWKSCVATIAEGEGWATIYFIESQERNKGHATELCKILKHVYRNVRFGGTVALNPAMKRVYEKAGVKEYEIDDEE